MKTSWKKIRVVAGNREEHMLMQVHLKLRLQKVNTRVRGHPTLLSTAEVKIFVFPLIYYFSKGDALPHPLGN